MHYYHYRFYIADDLQVSCTESMQQKIDACFMEQSELKLERISCDLTSAKKSISILSRNKHEKTVQNIITHMLLAEDIPINDSMEMEILDVDVPEMEPAPVSHKKSHKHKKKKKKHHQHKHQDKEKHTCHAHDCHSHEAHDHHKHDHDHEGHDHDHDEHHWGKAALGLLWGGALLILSFFTANIPIIALYVITGLTALVTLFLGYKVYWSAIKSLFNNKWNSSTLYTISTLTILVMSIVSLFVPGLPLMFEAAPLVLGFWHLGEGIEHTLLDEINKKLDVRDCVAPEVSLRGKKHTKISVKTLIPNDVIKIKKGGVIPVDGTLMQDTLLYTTRIDGSPFLKEFKSGDTVKAGMSLASEGEALTLRVTKTYNNSYLSLIAKNIKKANDEKAPVEIFANTVLKYFIPALLAVAVISGIIIGCLFTPALAIQCVVAVLVSACPCALSIITPLSVKIGMKKAADKGIHFKNGKALQAAAEIDAIVFDLNGTLTQGTVAIKSLNIVDTKYLRHVALLESLSPHPAAKVIKSYAEEQSAALPDSELEVSDADTTHHSGIKAHINNELFMIGNSNMLLANGIHTINEPYDNPENGSIYIVRGTMVIGQIALTDPLRADAIATVKQLKELGKSVHICTGADKTTAQYYARLLDIPIENICSNTVGAATSPDELSKTSYLEQLKNKGLKVAMVGDAANDVTAIAYSDLGVAVRSSIGDEITEDHAGIVVQQGLLFPIATAFDVAKKSKNTIIQNLAISLTYNSVITLVAAGLFVAIGFALNPAIGVALMVLESIIILANLYFFKKQDVLTEPKPAVTEVSEEPVLEESTTKVLDALGSQPKPEAIITNAPIPHEEPVLTKPISPREGMGLFGSVQTRARLAVPERINADIEFNTLMKVHECEAII